MSESTPSETTTEVPKRKRVLRNPRAPREFVRVGFRLPAETMDVLNAVAAATGVSVEDQVRAATVRLAAELGSFNDFTLRLAKMVEQANTPEVVRKLPEADTHAAG